MSREAADVVASVLRKHLTAGGHVDHMTGVVSVRCKACQVWIPDSGDHRGGFKAHVAAEVVAALGGLTRQWTYEGEDEDGQWVADEIFTECPTENPEGNYRGGHRVGRWVSGLGTTGAPECPAALSRPRR